MRDFFCYFNQSQSKLTRQKKTTCGPSSYNVSKTYSGRTKQLKKVKVMVMLTIFVLNSIMLARKDKTCLDKYPKTV